MDDQLSCDVLVVGGGAAGLSGALTLARARFDVVVVDAGAPRNAPAEGVHGLLGHDGLPPGELLARGRAEVERYGGRLVRGEVVGVRREGERFVARLADGSRVAADRLLVTTGLVDELPDLPGVRERWGRDVIHCPFCHGWEVRDRPLAVLATGPMAVHQALLVRRWTADVVLLAHDQPLDAEAREQLSARGVRVVEGRVSGLEIVDDALTGVRMADGSVLPREVVMVGPRMVARSALLADLGIVSEPHVAGSFVPTDEAGRTSVPGVWAAGNVTDLMAQVGASAAAGAWAAAQIVADSVARETADAVEAARRSG